MKSLLSSIGYIGDANEPVEFEEHERTIGDKGEN